MREASLRRRIAVGAGAIVALLMILAWWALPGAGPPVTEAPRPSARHTPATPPAGEAWRDVRCELERGDEDAEVVVVVAHRQDATQTALIEGGAVTLLLPAGELTVLADVPGAGTIRLEVDGEGACRVAGTERTIELTIDVRFPSGAAVESAQLLGCGLDGWVWLPTDPIRKVKTDGQPCDLRATVRAASGPTLNLQARLDPAEGDQVVDMVAPYDAWASIAADTALIRGPDGAVLIRRPHPGTRAAELLEPEDLVVRWDGRATTDLTYADLDRLNIGQPDTEVELVVRDVDGHERTVVVPREWRTP